MKIKYTQIWNLLGYILRGVEESGENKEWMNNSLAVVGFRASLGAPHWSNEMSLEWHPS